MDVQLFPFFTNKLLLIYLCFQVLYFLSFFLSFFLFFFFLIKKEKNTFGIRGLEGVHGQVLDDDHDDRHRVLRVHPILDGLPLEVRPDVDVLVHHFPTQLSVEVTEGQNLQVMRNGLQDA